MQLSLPVPIAPAETLMGGLPATSVGGSGRPTAEENADLCFEALLNPAEPAAPEKPPVPPGTDPELAAQLALAMLLPPAPPTPPPAELSLSEPREDGTAAFQDDGKNQPPETMPWAATSPGAAVTARSPFAVGSSVRTYVAERDISGKREPAKPRQLDESVAFAAVSVPTLSSPLGVRPSASTATQPEAAIVPPGGAAELPITEPSSRESQLAPRTARGDARPVNLPAQAALFTLPTVPAAPPVSVETKTLVDEQPAVAAVAAPTGDLPAGETIPRPELTRISLGERSPNNFQSPVRDERGPLRLRSEPQEALRAGIVSGFTDQPAATVTPPNSVARALTLPGERDAREVAAAPVSVPTEKFAAGLPQVPLKPFTRENKFQKQFLSPQDQQDANALAVVGTDVAKDTTIMATLATPRPSTFHAVEPGASVANQWVATPESGSPAATLEKLVPMAAVRETMTAVLNAVEALASRADKTQSAVHMDFQVGAEKLGLHLALREGTVYTIFRTDSADLRTALGQEWQAVVPAMTARDGNVAAPVFAPASANSPGSADSASSSLGQGHPQQRGGQPAPETHFFSPGRPVSAPGGASSSVSVAPASAPSVSTSLLNAFA